MTGPTEMVPWLNACFDRAEQRARAATAGPWVAEVDDYQVVDSYQVRASGSETIPVAQAGCRCEGGAIAKHADAAHIADLDPSWRLADIGRKWKLFALHSPVTTHTYSHGLRIAAQQCDHCASLCHSRSGLACEDPDAPWPCPTVRLLAEEFAGEPGYQESWRP